MQISFPKLSKPVYPFHTEIIEKKNNSNNYTNSNSLLLPFVYNKDALTGVWKKEKEKRIGHYKNKIYA